MKDILSYESDIWSCADLLISSGIKQSKFPDYMSHSSLSSCSKGVCEMKWQILKPPRA
ncbi:hypothetical protein [Barnesiella intestinihominis]|uniref:hypothetical protein n=1 Tax=Barnesiella intestinihominis TaxID=487174 RepID=UPI001E38DB7A|nr:hypothetical protein [Barnesiella intestinihominis]